MVWNSQTRMRKLWEVTPPGGSRKPKGRYTIILAKKIAQPVGCVAANRYFMWHWLERQKYNYVASYF